jgi:hypothetical protein
VNEQQYLEEKEENLHLQENKIRSREIDYEKKLNELRQKESETIILMEKYSSLRNDLEIREKHCHEQVLKNNTLSSNLLAKESLLNSKEIEIKNNEVKYLNLNKLENEINLKIFEFKKEKNYFYHQEVAGITTRHCVEVKRLEEIIQQQLEISSNLQFEINKLRELLSEEEREGSEWRKKDLMKIQMIEKLEGEMKELEEERDGLKEQLAEAMVGPTLLLSFPPLLPSDLSSLSLPLLPPSPPLSLPLICLSFAFRIS